MKSRTHLIFSYLLLVIILAVALWFFYSFSGFPDRQFFVVVLTASFYFCWGIIYHLFEGDLHPKIVVEYLLIALLAIFLLRGAVYR